MDQIFRRVTETMARVALCVVRVWKRIMAVSGCDIRWDAPVVKVC